MKKNTMMLSAFILLCSVFVQAQTGTIVLDKKVSPNLLTATKNYDFNSDSPQSANFQFVIQNGDGLNYFQQPCNTGNIIQRLLCSAKNVVTAAWVLIDRPKELEIKLNGSVVVNRTNFPKEKGQYSFNRTLTNQQALSIYVKGLPTSSVSVKVFKFGSTNASPIANFTYNSSSFFEPSLVSFSGIISSDSDGTIASYSWNFGDGSFGSGAVPSHTYASAGQYNVVLTVTDNLGAQASRSETINILSDSTAPVLSNIQPHTGTDFSGNAINLSGEASEPLAKVEVQVNSEPVVLAVIDPQNSFRFTSQIQLATGGSKNVLIRAYDAKNNFSEVQVTYNVNFNNPPVGRINLLSQSEETAPSMIWFDASSSSDADMDQLSYEWSFDDGSEVSTDIKPTHFFKNAGSYNVRLKVTDIKGAVSIVTRSVVLAEIPLPIDPAEIAPPLAENVVQSKAEKFEFFYTDPQAPQKNVDVSQMEPERITPLRGRVLKDANDPLSGVKITIKDHPEFGYTYSREDGYWDMAVNGGGNIVVIYEKAGYTEAVRELDTAKYAARVADDVVLSEIDQKSTEINFNTSVTQVHEASVVQDESGIRKTQIVIPQNTTAQIVLPDGSTRAVDKLTVRATEVTVGSLGQNKMPGPLPARSAYTYCADFTADEAIALNADKVEFSQPVPVYVDNYLNIPTGKAVPVGYFNAKTGFWEASDDGLVIKVLSVGADSKARLDLDGNGSPADQSTLNSYAITDSELLILGQKFQEGQSFWRVRVKHFSVYDFNWNAVGVSVAGLFKNISGGANNGVTDAGGNTGATGANSPDVIVECGCEIDPRQRSVSEQIALPGLDFNLHYNSTRAQGSSNGSSINLSLFPTLNIGGRAIRSGKVTVEVAGKKVDRVFEAPALNTGYSFSWDGYDSLGRQVYESVEAVVTLSYFVDNIYQVQNPIGIPSFNSPFQNITGTPIAGRGLFEISRTYKVVLSSLFDRNRTVNFRRFHGWSISPYHSYDPTSKTLFKGSGESFKANKYVPVVTNVAGNGTSTSSGEGVNANSVGLANPTDVTKDAAGNIYVTDAEASLIKKIDKNGIITHVAGNGNINDFLTDNEGPALNAGIGKPHTIRVTEAGVIYFTDSKNSLVRKINQDGIISIVAGSIDGTSGSSGNNGLAINAKLNSPMALALSPDGSIYVGDTNNNQIRRIDAAGVITFVLAVSLPKSMAFDQAGNLYYSSGGKIFVYLTNNTTRLIAGNDGINFGPYEEFGDATVVLLKPGALAVGANRQVYFIDIDAQVIRTVNQNGKVVTLAGKVGAPGYNGNGKVSAETQILNPTSLWVDVDGSIYFTDKGNSRVRKIGDGLPTGFPTLIASVDGTEIYYFNEKGQHNQTKRADTGAVKYTFIHNSDGHLVQVIDAYQKVTNLNRDSSGALKNLAGPFGQVYHISLDQNNFLASIRDPLNNTTNVAYTSTGLMTAFQKPEGNSTYFEYDSTGALTKVTEPNGGTKTFSLNSLTGNVEVTTTGNTVNKYYISNDGQDSLTAISSMQVSGLGVVEKTDHIKKGYSVLRTSNFGSSDNMELTQYSSADPRFSGQSGYISRSIASYPIGTIDSQFDRSYATNQDGINFVKTETSADNAGFSETTTFNSETKVISTLSSLGKKSVLQIDENQKPLQINVGNSFLPVNYSYDNLGRLANVSQGNRITVLNYDQNGNLSEVVDPENRSTQFVSDAIGRVTKTRTPDSEETLFAYDRNSNLVGITPPQRALYQFVINSIDFVASFVAPGAPAKTYTYDEDRRLKNITSENQRNIGFTYSDDPENLPSFNGQIYRIDSDLSFIFRYNNSYTPLNREIRAPDYISVIEYNWVGKLLISKNNISSYRGNTSNIVSYTYNPAGLLPASESAAFGSIGYSFNADKLLVQIGDLSIGRDNSTGLVEQKTLGNLTENIGYSEYGEISSRDIKLNGSTVYKEIYARDKLGRIITKNVTKNGVVKDFGYEYDPKGRLVKAFENTVLKNTYTYDAQGNRLSKNSNYAAQYDGQDRILSYTKDLVQTTFSYNDDGTRVTEARPGETVRYDISLMNPMVVAERQSVARGNLNIKYYNSAELKRAMKFFIDAETGNPDETIWTYDKDQRLIAERHPQIDYNSRFIYGTQSHSPDYMISSRGGTLKTYFFVKDQLGSIVQVVDANGIVVQDIEYDEFGKMLSNTNPKFQPFGFAGGHYDPDTGLTRFGARDYNPETGRWLERDPILFYGGSTNLYSYCGNDPINCIDPSGLTQEEVDAALAWLNINHPELTAGTENISVRDSWALGGGGLSLPGFALIDTNHSSISADGPSRMARIIGIVAHELMHHQDGLLKTILSDQDEHDGINPIQDAIGKEYMDSTRGPGQCHKKW